MHMPGLLDTFDFYNDFTQNAYFAHIFEVLPSSLRLKTPLKETRENMEAVIEAIDLVSQKLVPVFKNWKTEDARDADRARDFPYQQLYKSENRKLIIWVTLGEEELMIDFLYDLADMELEQWIIATNDKVLAQFGETKRSTFKVLSHNGRYFFTEDVRTTEPDERGLSDLYNDDFQEIDDIIVQSIEESRSGLILFHGEPGTGKTSYLKSLIHRFPDTDFIFVQNDFVKDLLKPEFVSFLLKRRNSILIIEDAERVVTTRENTSQDSVVSTVLQLTDGLFSDYLNIKIVCTFNTGIEKVDKALLRKGRMIAKYEFKALSADKTAELTKSLGFAPVEKEMRLADIFKLSEKDFAESDQRKKIGF